MSKHAKQLWDNLSLQQIVNGEYVELEAEKSPWYLRILLGFSGWIAALFALGFLGTMFSFLFKEEGAALLFSLGLITSAVAYAIFKLMPKNEFSEQLGLVFNLTGQLMIGFGIYQLLESLGFIEWRKDALFFLLLAIIQVGFVFVISDFTSRALSSLFAIVSAAIFFDKTGFGNIGILLAVFSFMAVWLSDTKWKGYAGLWSAVGYGTAAALLILNIDIASGEGILDIFNHRSKTEHSQVIPWFAKIGLCLAFISTLSFIAIQYQKENSFSELKFHYVLGAILATAALMVDGIAAPLTICLIGFYVQRSVLLYCGIVSLIGFFSWYYYNLELTLLFKSALLIGLGFVLLGSFLYFSKRQPNTSDVNQSVDEKSRIKWLGLASVILVLAVANYDIVKKEKILSDGKKVHLELAPVDPRSIMQGDYITLRFKIENELMPEAKKHESGNYHGLMLLELDDNHIGTFKKLYDGGAIENHQAIIKFRKRSYDIKLATNAFFFQEGKAKQYEAAKYGEFRVDENGEIILNALLDENLKVLGLNRPNQ